MYYYNDNMISIYYMNYFVRSVLALVELEASKRLKLGQCERRRVTDTDHSSYVLVSFHNFAFGGLLPGAVLLHLSTATCDLINNMTDATLYHGIRNPMTGTSSRYRDRDEESRRGNRDKRD